MASASAIAGLQVAKDNLARRALPSGYSGGIAIARRKLMTHRFLAAALLFLFAAATAVAQDVPTPPEAATGFAVKALAVAEHHMIVAANPLAASAGLEMLRAGGSAVDAVIATQLVLGLVEPQSSGLGGGAFLVHWDEEARDLKTYDGRETAPAGRR